MNIVSPSHIWQTLRNIQQILCYLKTFWYDHYQHQYQQVQNHKDKHFDSHMLLKMHSNSQLSITKQKQNKSCIQLSSSYYKVNQGKMYLSSTLNRSHKQQLIKLKNTNAFFQVIKGLQSISSKLFQYQNIQQIHDNHRNKHKKSSSQQHKHINDTSQLQYLHLDEKIFNNLFKQINQNLFKQSFQQMLKKSPKQLAIYLLQIQTKLSVIPFLIDSASVFVSDITSCQPNYEKYSHAWRKIQMVDMQNNKQTIAQQIVKLKRMMKITTSAVVAEGNALENELVRKMVFGISFPYYWLADQDSELQCYKIWRNPKVQSLNKVWNLPEKGALKQCKKIIFPSIATHFFIYIPPNIKNNKKQNQSQLINIFEQSNPSIRALVLYYSNFGYAQKSKKYQKFSLFSCMNVADEVQIDTIMIHLHGGGFVALSSETSQSYTRKWANQLKIPIFSIDYRKPPAYRFPVPLQDCYTAYTFIIQNIDKYLKIKPKNIILAGDSAGGNLTVALYAMLLKNNYNVLPYGMFLAYPAVDLRMKFSPSRINSFDDPILLPPLLLLCLKQYLGDHANFQSHPLASPLLLTQHFIKYGEQSNFSLNLNLDSQLKKWPRNWPKTTIMVGKKDPLYDDSLRLLQRMTQAGVQAKLIVYSELTHAFLSLDYMVNFCEQAIKDSIVQIHKLLRRL